MGTNKVISTAILEAFPVASFVIDADHTVTHWNRACEVLTGVPGDEMVGTKNQWQAFYSSQRMIMADLILRGAGEAQVAHYYHGKFRPSAVIPGTYEAEDFFPGLGDEGRWLYFTAAPLRDHDGTVIGAIETLQDISERRRAEDALKESEERFKTLSRTDPLTQLFNFRDFYEQLEHEIERAGRYDRPLSLAIIDVDNFKEVNDRHGHLVGDQVLRQLGELIRGWKRRTDKGFRYGGDEFAVLMPEAGVKQAMDAARRLMKHLAALNADTGMSGGTPACTLSIGVAQYLAGEAPIDFVQRADAAAYQAKRRGRNCVVRSEGNPVSGE